MKGAERPDNPFRRRATERGDMRSKCQVHKEPDLLILPQGQGASRPTMNDGPPEKRRNPHGVPTYFVYLDSFEISEAKRAAIRGAENCLA